MAAEGNDFVMGSYGDPTVFYGPSASRVAASPHKESEPDTLTDASLDGPVSAQEVASPLSGITPREFVKRPAGLLLVLLIPAYILFHKVFGAAG